MPPLPFDPVPKPLPPATAGGGWMPADAEDRGDDFGCIIAALDAAEVPPVGDLAIEEEVTAEGAEDEPETVAEDPDDERPDLVGEDAVPLVTWMATRMTGASRQVEWVATAGVSWADARAGAPAVTAETEGEPANIAPMQMLAGSGSNIGQVPAAVGGADQLVNEAGETMLSAAARPGPSAPLELPGQLDAARPVRPVPSTAAQVAEAVIRMEGERTEIALSPAELGSVRIHLTRDSQALVIHLWADRPETLDLMRRHADMLLRELAAAGEDGARLDFGAAGGERYPADGSPALPVATGPADEAPAAAAPDIMAEAGRVVRLAGRIDIRI